VAPADALALPALLLHYPDAGGRATVSAMRACGGLVSPRSAPLTWSDLQITMAPIERMAMKIRKRRTFLKLTQAQLADKAGVTREYIARLEAGRYDPSLSVIEKLAKALKLKASELLK
jgi:DNA-binding XRE family transcriptional regulator